MQPPANDGQASKILHRSQHAAYKPNYTADHRPKFLLPNAWPTLDAASNGIALPDMTGLAGLAGLICLVGLSWLLDLHRSHFDGLTRVMQFVR